MNEGREARPASSFIIPACPGWVDLPARPAHAKMSHRRKYPRYVQPLQYAQGWLQQELEHDCKDQWQHDLARDIGCRQQRKDE
jgi:hypothetical protein